MRRRRETIEEEYLYKALQLKRIAAGKRREKVGTDRKNHGNEQG